jgi:hypothetical protein
MSEQTPHRNDRAETPKGEAGSTDPDDYGSLTVEDEPVGTVDPADLAGTARPDDADVGYQPEWSEADDSGA